MQNILVIPDIHDCEYVLDYIESSDLGCYSKVIFLGDYTDGYFEIFTDQSILSVPCHRKDILKCNGFHSKSLNSINSFNRAGLSIIRSSRAKSMQFRLSSFENSTERVIMMLERIKKLKLKYYDKVILLLGNHDIAYMMDIPSFTFNDHKKPQYSTVSRQYLEKGEQYIDKTNDHIAISNNSMGNNACHVNQRLIDWFIDNAGLFDIMYKVDGDYEEPSGGLMFSHYGFSKEDIQSIKNIAHCDDMNVIIRNKKFFLTIMIKMFASYYEHDPTKESFYKRTVFGHCAVNSCEPLVFRDQNSSRLMCDIIYNDVGRRVQCNNTLITLSPQTSFTLKEKIDPGFNCKMFCYD